jgi:pimeloyl-ACP methyl ester carboxylesterase
MDHAITPFTIDVAESDIADLRDRLARTRWPDPETVDDWSQGVPLSYLQELCEYWQRGYNWYTLQDRLNAIPQFRTEVAGLKIHFFHARSPHPDARPIVLTYGWPGSIVEFVDVIAPLTDPTRFGGSAEDAFHVVCPSLPGFGFGDKPTEPGWGIERIAAAWIQVMSRLGYTNYIAQGHDWGNSVSTCIGQQDPDNVAGIHVIPPIVPPDPATLDDLTATEREAIASLAQRGQSESGYSAEQSTKPQTIGYALVDSPAALCAWIVEKFWTWTDSPNGLDAVVRRDRLLDNVMLYWVTRSGASAARLYWESFQQVSEWFATSVGPPVHVPTGASIFPGDVPRPSRRWAARRYTNIVYWNELTAGGHFAALEQPTVFVDELRSFARLLR